MKDFRKKVAKMKSVVTEFTPPKYWTSVGNFAVNKIVSGAFGRGIPQGRVTCLAGPSGSGKTYLLCNLLKNAQLDGSIVMVLDSENALDEDYLSKVGVDQDPEKFMYAGVDTFGSVVEVLSEFIKSYTAEFGADGAKGPKVMIALDSVDMLLTDTEETNFDKGVQKGDQGQRAKQQKHMLRTIVQKIKRLPISFVITHQVFPNSEITNGQGAWIINNGLRYSCSQIFLVNSLNLKDEAEIIGVRMVVETYKSRFAKKGSKVTIEVPYDTGINKYSGFVEMMVEIGVVRASGAWKYIVPYEGQAEVKFQGKFDDRLFSLCMNNPKIKDVEKNIIERMDKEIENVELDEDETIDPETGEILVS